MQDDPLYNSIQEALNASREDESDGIDKVLSILAQVSLAVLIIFIMIAILFASESKDKAAYYKNIAIPLSIGAQMIARGDIEAKGVLPPESVINPGVFFAELEKRGIKIEQKIE